MTGPDPELPEEPPGDAAPTDERVARAVGRLSGDGKTDRAATERKRKRERRAATAALTRLSAERPAALAEYLPVLLAELRAETERAASDGREPGSGAGPVRQGLVEAVARVVIDDPGAVGNVEEFGAFAGAVTTDLDDGTVRLAAEGLFAGAGRRPGDLATAVTTLGELLDHPDAAVRAWAAGAVGRLAEVDPGAAASVAGDLRRLLEAGDGTARHNAVEALAVLAGPRPDVVAPAADSLRDLLDHGETAVQHNAAGVLARLAADRPDVVVPAVDALAALEDHESEAVRRVAAGALVRLGRERSRGRGAE